MLARPREARTSTGVVSLIRLAEIGRCFRTPEPVDDPHGVWLSAVFRWVVVLYLLVEGLVVED